MRSGNQGLRHPTGYRPAAPEAPPEAGEGWRRAAPACPFRRREKKIPGAVGLFGQPDQPQPLGRDHQFFQARLGKQSQMAAQQRLGRQAGSVIAANHAIGRKARWWCDLFGQVVKIGKRLAAGRALHQIESGAQRQRLGQRHQQPECGQLAKGQGIGHDLQIEVPVGVAPGNTGKTAEGDGLGAGLEQRSAGVEITAAPPGPRPRRPPRPPDEPQEGHRKPCCQGPKRQRFHSLPVRQ